MTELLGGQIGVGDFIFAHKKGCYPFAAYEICMKLKILDKNQQRQILVPNSKKHNLL